MTAPAMGVEDTLFLYGAAEEAVGERSLTKKSGAGVDGAHRRELGGGRTGNASWEASAHGGTISDDRERSAAGIARATANGQLEGYAGGKKVGSIGGDAAATASARGSFFHAAKDPKNLQLGLQAEAGARVHAGGTLQAGNDEYFLRTRGAAGAGVNASGAATFQTFDGVPGINLSAGADAGVALTGEATLGAGPAQATVQGGVIAGVALGAGAQLGMQSDGKFHIGANFKIALGGGFSLGFDLAIDPRPIKAFFKKAGDTIKEKVIEPAKNFFQKAGSAIKKFFTGKG